MVREVAGVVTVDQDTSVGDDHAFDTRHKSSGASVKHNNNTTQEVILT